MTPPPIAASLLNPSLAHVVFSAGYDKTSSSALSTLSDAFVQYLAHLAQTAVGAASVSGRSRPTAKDVAVAVDLIGKGWPGGGMKDLLEWFEEEKKTRTTNEAAMFGGLGLPADEWITGFVTGGRTRIPNDEQEYSYVQDFTPSIGSREVEEGDKTDVDMDMNPATELETDDTPLESSNSKTPSRRRPEYIPDHLPPFPDELPNSDSGRGSEENDAKSGIPIVKKVQAGPTLDQSTKADKDATGLKDKSKTEVIPETISKSSERHATEKSDQQHEFFCRSNNVDAPLNTNGPISSNNHLFRSTASQSKTENPRSVLEAYTQIVPFAKSRLKEHTMTVSANLNDIHAQVHASDLSATASHRNSATSSAPSTSTAAKSPNSSQKLKVPHKDRPICAIQEVEKVLAALPAATASNGIHPMVTGLEAGIRSENALAEERSTDTLFGNSNISLLDKVVRKCSPHIVNLVTPTPIPIQPATSPVVGTSGPISAAISGVPQQRNASIPSSTINLGYPSTRLPSDRFDRSHQSIS